MNTCAARPTAYIIISIIWMMEVQCSDSSLKVNVIEVGVPVLCRYLKMGRRKNTHVTKKKFPVSHFLLSLLQIMRRLKCLSLFLHSSKYGFTSVDVKVGFFCFAAYLNLNFCISLGSRLAFECESVCFPL